MVRRAMALGVVVIAIALLGAVVERLLGDGATVPAVAAELAPGAVGSTPVDASSDPPGGTDPAPSPLPEPTEPPVPDPGLAPSAADPARVLILGDSDAGTFGPYLMTLLDGNGVTDSDLFYKVSSGLSRPDFFDWPAEIRSRVTDADPSAAPDIVVATFGGNDAQDLLIDGRSYPVTTDQWQDEYRRRVSEVVDLLTGDGRTLVWVGIPNAKSAEFTKRLRILRDVTVAELETRDDVIYVDTWDRFDGLSGGYADFVIDPRDGRGKNVRSSDGFHLNTTGAEILALDIVKVIEDELRRRGARL
jgi:uncharacterized protein